MSTRLRNVTETFHNILGPARLAMDGHTSKQNLETEHINFVAKLEVCPYLDFNNIY